jgi:hypothetical protein
MDIIFFTSYQNTNTVLLLKNVIFILKFTIDLLGCSRGQGATKECEALLLASCAEGTTGGGLVLS